MEIAQIKKELNELLEYRNKQDVGSKEYDKYSERIANLREMLIEHKEEDDGANETAAKGKKVDLGIAKKGEFTLDGENYYTGWYYESQDWNGWKIPYFEEAVARDIMKQIRDQGEMAVGKLYGGGVKDSGWWYSDSDAAPADRTVVTGQKIKTEEGEKAVWAIGGFEWTWGLKEIAAKGIKTEKMENKYRYLKIGNILKDLDGLRFEIVGYGPDGLKVKRYSEVEKNMPEITMPYSDIQDLADSGKLKFEGFLLQSVAHSRLLEMEIADIQKNLAWEETIKKHNAELEQANQKIEFLVAELSAVKSEANALMEGLEKNQKGFEATVEAMGTLAGKKKVLTFDGITEEEIDENYGKLVGSKNKEHKEYFKRLQKALLHFEKTPGSKFYIDKAGKGKMVSKFRVGDKVKENPSKEGFGFKGKTGTVQSISVSANSVLVKFGKEEQEYQNGELVYADKASKGKVVSDYDAKLDAFLKKFPDNAKSWADATDEMRDLARTTREEYNEAVLNVTEGEKGYVESIDFKAIKTPAEWNKKAKAQIRKLWSKMKDSNKENIIRQYENWFN